ncbi:MAG TPA: hypothetical protein VG148_12260 [Pyrinomonadaceae bacterium]|nr:hypothetical protein [Pyrinomonadaceae bacterium]
MKTRIGKRLLAATGALLLVALCVSGIAVARRLPQKKMHLPKEYRSEVKDLEVEGAKVRGEGTDDPVLVVVLRNKSALAVTSYTVTVGNIHVGQDGGLSVSDDPLTVIEPYGTTEVYIPVSNFTNDEPLVVTAVFYADGTEDGREQVRRWTRDDRAQRKAERAARKGEPEP